MNNFHYPERENLHGFKNYQYYYKNFSDFLIKMIRKLNINFTEIFNNNKQCIIWCIK